MTDERPLRLGGWALPSTSRAIWVAVGASIAGYFVFGRAAANLIAIVGAIVVTVVIVMRDRAAR